MSKRERAALDAIDAFDLLDNEMPKNETLRGA
jgi:hypothetical protein